MTRNETVPVASIRSIAPWRPIVKASTATGALTNPATTTTKPSTSIDVQRFPAVALLFAGTDAADETVNYQVIGWSQAVETTPMFWMPAILAKGNYTLGTMTFGAAGNLVIPSATLFADTITEDTGRSGHEIREAVANAVAMLLVDTSNHELITVETDLDTAASATVMYRRGELPQGFGLPELDSVDNAGVGIDIAHHKIHEARSWYAYATAALGIAGTLGMMITTPNTATRIHLIVDWTYAKAGLFQLFKSATHTDGDAFVPVPRNLDIATASTAAIAINPSDGANGVEIEAALVGTNQRGGETRETEEHVLAQNTKYLALLTSETAANNSTLRINWYED